MTLPHTTGSAGYREAVAIAQAAERLIERGGEGPEPLIDVLRLRLQRERDAGLRLRLARAYLHLLRTSATPVAVEWIRGEDPMLREAAYEALRELGEEALPALAELVDSRDSDIRWYGYEIAAHLRRPSTVPVLIRGLKDDAPGNCWTAGNGLIRLGSHALIPVLIALVTAHPTLTFHAAARRVLARLDVPHRGDLALKLLDSLAHGTTTVQSGPIAAELLAALRLEMRLRNAERPDERRRMSATIERKVMMATKLITTIRRAGFDDAAAMRSLWEECGLAPVRDEEWSSLTAGSTSAILLAEHDGRIVGSVVATFDGWRAYVYHVAVAEPFRSQGVGHDLMAAAEEYLFALGARDVYAAVHEENTAGLALAVATGYLPEGERVLVKTMNR